MTDLITQPFAMYAYDVLGNLEYTTSTTLSLKMTPAPFLYAFVYSSS